MPPKLVAESREVPRRTGTGMSRAQLQLVQAPCARPITIDFGRLPLTAGGTYDAGIIGVLPRVRRMAYGEGEVTYRHQNPT